MIFMFPPHLRFEHLIEPILKWWQSSGYSTAQGGARPLRNQFNPPKMYGCQKLASTQVIGLIQLPTEWSQSHKGLAQMT